jgi:hypothetical protein
MKKGLLSFLLAALTLVGCQNYDDQFDELNAKILALQSELTSISAIQSAITDLNTKIAAVQSSALTAADLAGIISDLDAVQAAVANLGSVGTEVENLNAEVDEILAALDDLLAANAVINQDLRITSDAELKYVAALVNLDPTPTVIVNGYVEVDATFAATSTSKIDSISAITNKINTILGNDADKGLVASSANLSFNELSFLDANLEVTAAGVALPKLVTVGGDIDLNYAGAYSFPLVSRAGTITLVDGTGKGTSVNFEGLTTATVIRSAAGVLSLGNATSVKLGSISLPASVTLAKCSDFTTLQDASAGQGAFSAAIGGSVTTTTISVDMSKMKKFTGTVTIVTGGTSPSTLNLGSVASAGQLNINSQGNAHLDALAGIHAGTIIAANSVVLDAVTSTTAVATITLPAGSSLSMPALTSNAATITALQAKTFSAPKLVVGQDVQTLGGTTASVEVGDVANLDRLDASKILIIHSQDSDLNFNSFGVTLTTLTINGKEKTGDTANQDNDITITASNTNLSSLSITDAASMFSSLTVSGSTGLVTITTAGSIRDFTVKNDSTVKEINFGHSHIQGNGSAAATIVVSNTGVTALDMTSMRKVKHISITGNSALASISAPVPATTDGEENFAETSALVTVTIQDNATTATYSRAVTGTDVTDYGYAYFSAGAAWIKSFKDWFDMFTGDAANAGGANNKRTVTAANIAGDNYIQNLTFDIEIDVVTMGTATYTNAAAFAADAAGAAGATGGATDNQNNGGNISTYNELALSTATSSSIGY